MGITIVDCEDVFFSSCCDFNNQEGFESSEVLAFQTGTLLSCEVPNRKYIDTGKAACGSMLIPTSLLASFVARPSRPSQLKQCT